MKDKNKSANRHISTVTVISLIETSLIILSLVICIILSESNKAKITKQNASHLFSNVTEREDRIQENLISYIQFSHESSTSDDVNYLSGHYYEIINDPYHQSTTINNVKKSFNAEISYDHSIDDIALLVSGGEYSGITYDDLLVSTTSDLNTKAKYTSILNDFQYSSDYQPLQVIDGQVYFLYSENDYCGKKYLMRMSQDYLIDLFSIWDVSAEKMNITSLSQDGQLVYLIYNTKEQPNLGELNRQTNQTIHGTEIYISKTIANCFTLQITYDMNPVLRNSQLLFFLIIVIVIIGEILISFLLTYLFAGKPIKNVTMAMKEVEKGNLDVRIDVSTKTDFQQIYDGFNNMTENLSIYIQENYVQELQIKESEFKVLQSQINPHFLYNCFANISSLCKCDENEKAAKFTNQLAKYYFYITENIAIVTIKDEYEHMRQFLEIQNIRFEDRIHYEIEELPEEIASYPIPKLIFQPIVENSYKYVFSKMPRGGILRFRITQDKENIYFHFADNNQDLTEEEIKMLQERIINASLIGKHGLTNISRRLEYFSEGKDKVSLSKSDIGGLEVTVMINKEAKRK